MTCHLRSRIPTEISPITNSLRNTRLQRFTKDNAIIDFINSQLLSDRCCDRCVTVILSAFGICTAGIIIVKRAAKFNQQALHKLFADRSMVYTFRYDYYIALI